MCQEGIIKTFQVRNAPFDNTMALWSCVCYRGGAHFAKIGESIRRF